MTDFILDRIEAMLRLPTHSRVLYGVCRSLTNRLVQRAQSTSSSNVALEPNTSNMSIFSGHIKGAITNNLQFIRPENITPISIYQVLDADGKIKNESHTPDVRH